MFKCLAAFVTSQSKVSVVASWTVQTIVFANKLLVSKRTCKIIAKEH